MPDQNSQDPSLPETTQEPASQGAAAPASASQPAGSEPIQRALGTASGSWIWDHLAAAKTKTATAKADLASIEESSAPPDVKGFLRFNQYAGEEKHTQPTQSNSVAAQELREQHQRLMQRYEEAKKNGESFS